MKKRLTMFLAAMFLCMGTALAQTKVSGTVLSQDDGQPIIGAAVKVVGTSTGMLTDVNGRFNIALPAGKNQLEISYLGYLSQTVTAKNGMRVFLKSDAQALDEVVVTAMGITRQQKTLGYSAQTLDSDELTVGKLTDVTSAMAGKVAGVQINTTSSDPGSANSVIIRGISSINGSNQPLYIVDGVPLVQTTFRGSQKEQDQFQNAVGGVSNINPNDIENMTVLKGAAATALYGSRAANGVIIITTKTGKKHGDRNFQISYDGSLSWRNVATLPKMQNKFGQGWNGKQTFIENGSWGPEMDGSSQVYGPIWNYKQLEHKYSAVEDNVKDFFESGINTSHSVALNGISGDQKMTYYLSYSFASDNGILPGDKDTYKRHTLAYRGSYQATDWFKLSANMNLAKTQTNTVANDAKQVYGKVQADINPIKQLTLTYRFGFDYTDYDHKIGYPQIALDDALINEDYGYAPSNMNQSGYVFNRYMRKYEVNHDFLANFADKYLDGKLDVNVNVGLNINERGRNWMDGQTDDLTFYSGFWQLSNGATKTTLEEYTYKRRLIGLFGDISLGWDEMIYLGFTARNDWSSTLPKEKKLDLHTSDPEERHPDLR